MDDLISRSAAIDVLKETGIIQDNDLGHLVVDEINRIPIAYNVDKVVEQINKKDEIMSAVITKAKAIELIKAGGVE